MARFLRLLNAKWYPPSPPPADSFKNCSVLITGATGGLGLEAAIHYVNLGASRVIITGRTLSRGSTAKAIIESRTGKKDIIEVRELNMDTLAGVKTFADALTKEINKIDIVLLNAGVWNITYKESPDGWEETLQVNALSTIFLGLILLPWMRKSRPDGRDVQHLGFVSSGLHTTANIGANDYPEENILKYWSEEKHFLRVPGNYAMSKLFMMYGVNELAKLARDENGRLDAFSRLLQPLVGKQLTDRNSIVEQMLPYYQHYVPWRLKAFYYSLGKSTEAGARTLVLSACTVPEEHGKYIRHYSTEEEYAQQAAKNLTNEAGKDLQGKVWKEMLEIFETTIPGVSGIAEGRF